MDGILTHVVITIAKLAGLNDLITVTGMLTAIGGVLDGGRDGGGEVRPQAEPGPGKVCGVEGMIGVKSFSPMLIFIQ